MKYIEPTDEEKEEYLAYNTFKDVLDNLKSYKMDVKLLGSDKIDVLFCGAMAAFDKGTLDFLNELVKANKEIKFCLLSEVTAEYRRYTAERVDFPFICTPHLFAKEMIITGMYIPVTEEQMKQIESKSYLIDALKNVKARHIGLGNGYGEAWVFYAYKYICTMLDSFSPKVVVLWNEFYAFHHIIQGVCKEKKISLMYMEFGCIPGTMCIEHFGQQGESYPARKPLQFNKIKVSTEEIRFSKEVIEYLKRTGLNRNIQSPRLFSKNFMQNYNPKRKTIVFFGHNEYESGVYPYTNTANRYHSPIFKSSLEALEYLSVLSVKNNLNLIFKPHPIMVDLGHNEKNIEGVEYIDDVNINSLIDFSDLVVTIVSQVAYIALIREKPVLMLGYTQLKRKKCSYEAFKTRDIERKLKRALKVGYTNVQKNNFNKHVARLLKEYLYDDMQSREIPFGKKELKGVFDVE